MGVWLGVLAASAALLISSCGEDKKAGPDISGTWSGPCIADPDNAGSYLADNYLIGGTAFTWTRTFHGTDSTCATATRLFDLTMSGTYVRKEMTEPDNDIWIVFSTKGDGQIPAIDTFYLKFTDAKGAQHKYRLNFRDRQTSSDWEPRASDCRSSPYYPICQ